jgi:hypothetical protein
MDMKKLGRIPDGGGRRRDPRFIAGEIGDATRTRVGYDTLHVAVDDYSRLAQVEVLPDVGKLVPQILKDRCRPGGVRENGVVLLMPSTIVERAKRNRPVGRGLTIADRTNLVQE